jgi:DNA helicase IV
LFFWLSEVDTSAQLGGWVLVDRESVKAEEQAYFDRAYDQRERMRARLDTLPEAAAHGGAADKLREFAEHAGRAMRAPGSAVAFGRMDTDQDETWYVGYHAIWDDQSDILVVNWQAPIATPFYEANVDDPMDLRLRRDFSTEGNKILEFQDVVFDETLRADVARLLEPAEGPGPISDALLEDLERHRTGEMQDIVRTIQQAQYRLIRADLDQLLVIQGGPGTGKTAVALHRLSWLLFNHRDKLTPDNVLVVGPNPTFIRYIQKVLPGLGDRAIRQSALTGLVPDVQFGATEGSDLAKLKGDSRMERLVDRGLQDRISVPDETLQVDAGTTVVTFEPKKLAAQTDRFRALRFTAGRQRLREYVREEVIRRAGRSLERDGQIDALVDRVWPSLTPQAFLRELYGSERRLITAAQDDFTAADVRALYRRSEDKLSEEVWTRADAAVLDYCSYAMNGPPARRYEHIVIDEAQDLSPMELGMIARRSVAGSMTVLGDVAQSAGGWARHSWDDVIEALSSQAPPRTEELDIGYRVPRQIFEFAAQLLPHIAPSVTAPQVVREGAPPVLVHATDGKLGEKTVTAAAGYASSGLQVGVIVPTSVRSEIEEAFSDRDVNWFDARLHGLSGPITLVSPMDCRGLEFDAVVVVEPEAIVESEEQGHRLLYVALTRATKRMTVIHRGQALPLPVGGTDEPATGLPAPAQLAAAGSTGSATSERERRAVDAFVEVLADEIRESLQPDLWMAVAEQLRETLHQKDHE